jgi:large subunit ribosomal protein L10
MSKFVKNLVTRDIQKKLAGVQDAVVANVVGMNSLSTFNIRKAMREKGLQMMVVKQSLAARATRDSNINKAFGSTPGSVAVVWGGEDFVSLCKTIVQFDGKPEYPKFELKGGVMDGEPLNAVQVKEVSKWPSRQEQISLLVGQILGPGATLSGQLVGPARKIAGQVKKMVEDQEAGS